MFESVSAGTIKGDIQGERADFGFVLAAGAIHGGDASFTGSLNVSRASSLGAASASTLSVRQVEVQQGLKVGGTANIGTINSSSAEIQGDLGVGGRIEVDSVVVSKSIDSSTVHTEALEASAGHLQHLYVNGTAEFEQQVFMEKSLTVQGAVVGSGPYIDSSDKRFKKNVQPLESALEKVERLEGVTYHLKVEEYPERNFDNSRQVGWIADELEKVVPELVTVDQQGYRSVAYSRSAPLIAQAVRELRAEMVDELETLREEIRHLRQQIYGRTKA